MREFGIFGPETRGLPDLYRDRMVDIPNQFRKRGDIKVYVDATIAVDTLVDARNNRIVLGRKGGTLVRDETAHQHIPASQWFHPVSGGQLSGHIGGEGHVSEQRSEVQSATRRTFETLRDKWKEENRFTPSVRDMCTSESYQRIIGMGEDVIPLILEELKEDPDHWFWALEAITGENPVEESHQGSLENMAHDWVAWGEEQGYI